VSKEAPAVVHVDKTARTQFLIKKHNPKYYDLLENFRRKLGVPIVMNTSLNIKGEPICRTPEDALNFFFATGVDLLVMGDTILEK
jgi:carbamoyltransferase